MSKKKLLVVLAAVLVVIAVVVGAIFLFSGERIAPADGEYTYDYAGNRIYPHNDAVKLDGILDEEFWQSKKWYTNVDLMDTKGTGPKLYYTMAADEYGLYIGSKSDDSNVYSLSTMVTQWRFHFAASEKGREDYNIVHQLTYDVAGNMMCDLGYIQGVHYVDGELNSGETKGASLELFIPWQTLQVDTSAGIPDWYFAMPQYTCVKGEATMTISPVCADYGTSATYFRFNEDGYMSADSEDAVIGDTAYGYGKSAGWDYSQIEDGILRSTYGKGHNRIYFKEYAENYIIETTIIPNKAINDGRPRGGILFQDINGVYHGVFLDSYDAILTEGLNGTKNMEKLHLITISNNTGGWNQRDFLGGIRDNPVANETEGTTLKVIKRNDVLYYFVNDEFFYAEKLSYLTGEMLPGLMTIGADITFKNYSCQAATMDEIDEHLDSRGVYGITVKAYSGGSVESLQAAIQDGDSYQLRIIPKSGYEVSSILINDIEMIEDARKTASKGIYTVNNAKGKQKVEVRFQELDETNSVSGSITFEGGTVNSAVEIILADINNGLNYYVVKGGADEGYSAIVPAGTYKLIAEFPDYMVVSRNVEVNGNATADIVLVPSAFDWDPKANGKNVSSQPGFWDMTKEADGKVGTSYALSGKQKPLYFKGSGTDFAVQTTINYTTNFRAGVKYQPDLYGGFVFSNGSKEQAIWARRTGLTVMSPWTDINDVTPRPVLTYPDKQSVELTMIKRGNDVYVYFDGVDLYHAKWNEVFKGMDPELEYVVGLYSLFDYEADIEFSNYSITFDSDEVSDFLDKMEVRRTRGTAVTSLSQLNGKRGKFYLTRNITGNTTTVKNFIGTLDCNGYTIETSVPLFDSLKYEAKVEDLNIVLTKNLTATGVLAGIADNVAISNVTVSGTGSLTASKGSAVGGLVGNACNSTFTNCSNSLNITGSAGRAVGGIVGELTNWENLTFTDCTNSGDLTAIGTQIKVGDVTYTAVAGGILGYAHREGVSFLGCSNSGDIAGVYAGGIVGDASGGYVPNGTGIVIRSSAKNDTINTGNITATQYAGGVIGQIGGLYTLSLKNATNSGDVTSAVTAGGVGGIQDYVAKVTVDNCVNKGKVTCTATEETDQYGYREAAGGIWGNVKGVGLETTMDITNVTNFGEVSGLRAGGILGKNGNAVSTLTNVTSGGSVSGIIKSGDIYAEHAGEGGVYITDATVVAQPVSSLSELNGKSGQFYLTGNITGNTTTVTGFTGTLDGNGYTIETSVMLFDELKKATVTDLNIVLTADLTAKGVLAGNIDGATITDVAITGTGKLTGPSDSAVGAFAGTACNSTFTNCSNAIDVTGAEGKNVGGIVGENTVWTDLKLNSCTNSGNITATGTNAAAGGVVGSLKKNYQYLYGCTNSGAVNGYYAGGVLGYTNQPDITIDSDGTTNTLNTGKITGTESAGGIIGFVDGNGNITVNKATNTGAVDGRRAGGIGGATHWAAKATVSGCTNEGDITSTATAIADYKEAAGGIWGCAAPNSDAGAFVKITDSTNSGDVYAIKAAGGILGKGQNVSVTITGCTNTGAIVAGENVGQIIGEKAGNGTDNISGNTENGSAVIGNKPGTESENIITSLSQLNNQSGDFVLGGNITGNTTTVTGFTGTLDGNGYTIETSVMLFDELKQGAIVQNLNIVLNTNLTAKGVLAGNADNATVTDVAISGTGKLTGPADSAVGAFAGTACNSTFTNCSNAIDVTGASGKNVGGIIGENTTYADLKLYSCSNSGTVTATGTSACAGGIVGSLKKQYQYLYGCSNSGAVNGYYAGGILGYANQADIKLESDGTTNTLNTGKVTGTESAGGIIGFVDGNGNITVSNATNKGTVEGRRAGGIGGATHWSSRATVTNCTNEGDITSTATSIADYKETAGGIWGCAAPNSDAGAFVKITDSTNSGDVYAIKAAGGILGKGQNVSVTITGCTNSGAIVAGENVGQIIGEKAGNGTDSISSNTENGSAVIGNKPGTTPTYNITYAGLEGATNTNPVSYQEGDTTVLAAPGNRDGYTFLGWYIGEEPITSLEGKTGNLTITAKWYEGTATVVASLSQLNNQSGAFVLGGNITGNTTTVTGFTGTLDGNGYTIETSAMLFNELKKATVKNLKVNLTANLTAKGVLTGNADNATVTDVAISGAGKLTGPADSAVGAFAGTACNSTFTNCSNAIDVTGASDKNVGGIVGENTIYADLKLYSCSNSGTVTATGTSACAGGIVGSLKKQYQYLYGCSNTGSIKGYYAGGILGYANQADIKLESNGTTNTRNTGKVTGTESAGGIIGFVDGNGNITVSNATNQGTVEGRRAGGIGGATHWAAKATVSGCTNEGNITSTATAIADYKEAAGGIWGCAAPNSDAGAFVKITDSKNSGDVYAIKAAGGILGKGQNVSVTITGCTNSGAIVAGENVGQIIGEKAGNGTDSISGNTENGSAVNGAATQERAAPLAAAADAWTGGSDDDLLEQQPSEEEET